MEFKPIIAIAAEMDDRRWIDVGEVLDFEPRCLPL